MCKDEKLKKVLLVDDHPVVRDGVRALLSKLSSIDVIIEAGNVEDALDLAQRESPDLVILDLFMGGNDGYGLIESLRGCSVESKILVFSMSPEDLFARNCILAGADGYLVKSDSSASLEDAIAQVLSGKTYLSERVLKQDSRVMRIVKRRQDLSCLTERELQVFYRLGDGKTTREISKEFAVSVKTVAAHRENMKAKLGLQSGAELNRLAISFAIGRRAEVAKAPLNLRDF